MKDRLRYRLRALWAGMTMRPMSGAEDEPPKDEPPKDEPPKDEPPKDEPPKDEPPKDEPKDDEPTAEELRRKMRETERHSKRESARKDKELADLRAKLKEREDADKTEQEKAIEAARAEGEKTAREAAEKGRRQDRLEVEATRLAAKGVQIGEGDEVKTVKFADPEDALVHLERAISRGEIDGDEVFDGEGKVKSAALKEALVELLEAKPHLRETVKEPAKPKAGDADGGKGASDAKGLEDMSPDEHFAAIRKP